MREINGCHSTSAYASKDIRILNGECASLVKVVQPANDSLQPANRSLQLAKRSVQLVKGILQLADDNLWTKREVQGLLSVRLGVAEERTGSFVHTLIL
jgi:hypothetical protein